MTPADFPDVWRRCQERRELLRRLAITTLKRDPDAPGIEWARHYARIKPLRTPLGSGEPQLETETA